jgi:hypothetical protein
MAVIRKIPKVRKGVLRRFDCAGVNIREGYGAVLGVVFSLAGGLEQN